MDTLTMNYFAIIKIVFMKNIKWHWKGQSIHDTNILAVLSVLESMTNILHYDFIFYK